MNTNDVDKPDQTNFFQADHLQDTRIDRFGIENAWINRGEYFQGRLQVGSEKDK